MPEKRRVLLVAGTRPEVIKIFSLYKHLNLSQNIQPYLITTGQQGDLLTETLNEFDLQATFQFKFRDLNRSLNELLSDLLQNFEELFKREFFHGTIVQGDTVSALAGAISSFNQNTPVFHVEAGLRSKSLNSPFPEEGNRKLIASITKHHFAPTKIAHTNLINEGVNSSDITVTGNTGIDTLRITLEEASKEKFEKKSNSEFSKQVLFTCHRRESFGKPLEEIFDAMRIIAHDFPNVFITYPVHPNHNVKKLAFEKLNNLPNLLLCAPMNYKKFVQNMNSSDLIITDSGGIQEEAAFLGIPIIVLRNITERLELLEIPNSKLIGTNKEAIVSTASEFLLKSAKNVGSLAFGDGFAFKRISKTLEMFL